jgi:hypothetical protein
MWLCATLLALLTETKLQTQKCNTYRDIGIPIAELNFHNGLVLGYYRAVPVSIHESVAIRRPEFIAIGSGPEFKTKFGPAAEFRKGCWDGRYWMMALIED